MINPIKKGFFILLAVLMVFTGSAIHANADESNQEVKATTTFNPVVFYGIFGQATKKAIINYKIDHRLPPKPTAGPALLQQLGLSNWSNGQTLSIGDRGPIIWVIQQKLLKQGYFKHASLVKPSDKGYTSVLLPEYEVIPGASEKQAVQKHSPVKKITVEATAYTANCPGCIGITKTGINLLKHPNKKVIAVDPDVIPLGTTVYVPGYGYAIAGDIGGAIDGQHIDVYFASKNRALQWGVKQITIKVIT